jgi:NADH-quinone oxidoreductase subunit B
MAGSHDGVDGATGGGQRAAAGETLRDRRTGTGIDERMNSKLREAFGSTPFITTKLDRFLEWIRGSSMFQFHFGIACCSIELMHHYTVKHDVDRFGVGVPRASPRQADLMVVPGTIVSKFAPRMKRLYDQIPEPKWVVNMGSCSISGGPFQEGYNVLEGAEEVIPVDIHVPGCPPRPEALIYGIAKLQERISNGESASVVVQQHELREFDDLPRDELVEKLVDRIDPDDLVMRYEGF